MQDACFSFSKSSSKTALQSANCILQPAYKRVLITAEVEGIYQGRCTVLYTYIKKIISTKNCTEQTTYIENHLFDLLFGFFNYIVYTEEVYIDPILQAQGRILREQGIQDNPENIKERLLLKGIRFYIAAWISW
jgi:hypothetical protein